VEVWRGSELVGGLYGVALGRVFYGESMFSRVTDASKVALKYLCDELIRREFVLIDCQMATPHLMSLGAKLVPRKNFIDTLASHAIPPDPVGNWQFCPP
jgi:leucyl/phenylalanyl-tRNA--protein transferase